jgi:hypothetical protein
LDICPISDDNVPSSDVSVATIHCKVDIW